MNRVRIEEESFTPPWRRPSLGRRWALFQVKIGIQLASLKLPFKKALLTAAQLGAQGVEIDVRNELQPEELSRTGVRHVRKMLEDLNLRASAVAFPTRRGYDVLDDLDRRIEATKRAMQFAYDIGANVVVNSIGTVPADAESPSWQTLTQSLSDIGRFGQRVGATLCAETGGESGADLLRLFNALPDGSLGVNFDPGNLIVNGHSPYDMATLLGRHILHVHAKDGVRDTAKGRGVEVPLGRGSAEFPVLLAMLQQHNFSGFATVERHDSPDPIGEIGAAVKFLRNL
jgi:sugar phosphate isomerase/epimerase